MQKILQILQETTNITNIMTLLLKRYKALSLMAKQSILEQLL